MRRADVPWPALLALVAGAAIRASALPLPGTGDMIAWKTWSYAAATEGCLIAEFNPLVLGFTNRFVREPLRLDGARWVVPQGPGLGIEMDEDALKQVVL